MQKAIRSIHRSGDKRSNQCCPNYCFIEVEGQGYFVRMKRVIGSDRPTIYKLNSNILWFVGSA